MAVATGVVGDALMPTRIALLDVAAERGGSTLLDSRHDAPLGGCQRCGGVLPIGVAVAVEDVRHFEGWAIHGPRSEMLRWRRWLRREYDRERVQGAHRRTHVDGGNAEIARRGGETAMA